MKCVRYWPDLDETETYSVYEVTMVTEDVMPNYTIRQFKVTHVSGQSSTRVIAEYPLV